MPFEDAQDDARRVREAADIVQVVSDHVALKPKGREYVGLCPFHDDHKPSMAVVPHKQIFHCFSCGAGGDVFSFLQRLQGMTFPEALKHLAERFGVTLTPRRPRAPGAAPQEQTGVARADIIAANHTAMTFFKAILRHETHGALARETIQTRGIAEDMVEAFHLGAAPELWDGLLRTAEAKSIPTDHLAAAGLLKTRDSGGHYDAFRNRLVFPIHNQTGQVIAFGARKLNPEDEPKYLNSPEHAAFDKSSTLFGLYQALKGIKRTGAAIITEGYTDVIACHQHGFDNAVATLGTALTARHAKVLRRLTESVILLFDSDEAGQRAADRATEIFFTESIDVRVAAFTDDMPAKDPDELLKTEPGPDAFRAMLDQARDLLEYRFDRLRTRIEPLGTAARANAIEDEIKELARLGATRVGPVRRAIIHARLAELARLPESQIAALIASARVPSRAADSAGDAPPSTSRTRGVGAPAEHALGCLLTLPSLHADLERSDLALIAAHAYPHAGETEVAQAVQRIAGSGAQPGLQSVLDLLEDPGAKDAAVNLHEHVSTITEAKPDRVASYFQGCIQRLREAAMQSSEQPADTQTESLDALAQRVAALSRSPDRRRLPKPSP
ncbi:MAG: DNA primase [Planctomycetota bacterium]